MKTKRLISIAALCAALVAGTAHAEAKMSTTKKVLIGAGVVAAVGGGAVLLNKMSKKGQRAEEATGSVRPQKAVRSEEADDDEDEKPRAKRKKVADRTVTGSVSRDGESCTVRKVDLFDKKGNFVKAERMRVCQ